MLVISRKNGQKIMINDDIVITVIDCKNGQCKIAIEADRDVKIFREEIYYQVKLANLMGKNTKASTVDSVSDMLKGEGFKLNDKIEATGESGDIQIDKPKNSKSIIVKKNNNPNI